MIGLFGFGRIGSRVARILTSFQPKEVLVHDSLDKSEEIQALRNHGLRIRQVEFEEMLTKSNLLSIHVPLYKKTRHRIGLEELKLMPSGSTLVNTARGGIVEEDALATALQNGILASAAVDVFELEPYKGPLTELENLIITPILVLAHTIVDFGWNWNQQKKLSDTYVGRPFKEKYPIGNTNISCKASHS